MIVAAGASYGQPEHASRNNIDAIVDCFGKALRKLAAKPRPEMKRSTCRS